MRVNRIAVGAISLLALVRLGAAAPIGRDNILVSVRHSIREFTPKGKLVQIIPLNYGGRNYPGNPPREDPNDLVVDQYGWIDVFNGYSNPFLTRCSPSTKTFEHRTFPDWDTRYLNTGGIASYQNFVFVTDTDNPAVAPGIVRFDLLNNTATRFATGTEFSDLNIGLNGKLYALRPPTMDIYVFDPITMQLLNHLIRPPGAPWLGSVSANQAGELFGISGGNIHHFDSNGVLINSRATGFTSLTDIDIDEQGRIIVGQGNGYVLIGESSLQEDFTSFLASDNTSSGQNIFVSFAHPIPRPVERVPTPTPPPPPSPSPSPAHDILVSFGYAAPGRDNSLREFTLNGVLLRSIHFTYRGGAYPGTEYLRDIVVDQNGVINAFNGTFFPFLTRFSWNCSIFTHTTYPEWSTTNYHGGGGIAAYENFVFVSDESTGDASGIVRFDTSNNTASRVLWNQEFFGLSMGLDGKLYTRPETGGIDVYNPTTMQLIRHLSYPSNFAGGGRLAVDQTGNIFTTSWYGTIYRLDNNGTLLASTATGFPHLTDIDIDETGRIVAVSDEGWVIVGDSSLTNFGWFRALDELNTSPIEISVSFAPLVQPEPVQLIRVMSEKNHGSAGTFDLDLKIDGKRRGVECRSGGPTGDHSLIFVFAHNLLQVDEACSSNGIVNSAMIDPTDSHRYIVNLTGVSNAGYVVVTLNGLTGSANTYSDTIAQEMGVLVGDITGDGLVSTNDVYEIYLRSGRQITTSNFRSDVTIDGSITINDVGLTQSMLGTTLPYPP